MDPITAAVISVGIERQSRQTDANASLLRAAKRTDAAVIQLLDAAKSLEQAAAGDQQSTSGHTSDGKGSIISIIA